MSTGGGPVLVTGATGFIGRHVVRSLLDRGHAVRAMVRPGRSLPHRTGLSSVHGDLRDSRSLARAIEGCDGLVHVAALYSYHPGDRELLHEVNVEGTRRVLRVAREAGVRRAVYTSSVSTLSFRRGGAPADESTDARPADLVGPYKRSKFDAEQVARWHAWQGLPLVIVNPTAPVGPGDARPSPTGEILLRFLRGRFPAYVDTGLNLVDVADVAEGHALALERGEVGQRYLLGHAEGNLTLRDLLATLADLTGLPAPRRRLPWRLAIGAAYVDHWVEWGLLRRGPRIPLEATRMARGRMWADPGRAIRDLGMPQSPVRAALRRAVDWYIEEGYVDGRRAQGPQRHAGDEAES